MQLGGGERFERAESHVGGNDRSEAPIVGTSERA
jgi:hypothetical protein